MKITKEATVTKVVGEVTLKDPTVESLIMAERVSGKSQGFEFLAAVVSQVGTFDGEKIPPEEVKRLSSKDFLTIVGELDLANPDILPSESSTLPGKESSATAG